MLKRRRPAQDTAKESRSGVRGSLGTPRKGGRRP
jgi:hypothetical protein